MYILNNNLASSEFEEGIALFDKFSGDTHFIYPPSSMLIQNLSHGPKSEEQLTQAIGLINDDKEIFQQLLAEALASGIIRQS